LINNAGVAGNLRLGEPITVESFNRQYTINVLALILLTQACMEYLPTDRSGRIVNLSSVSSSLGFEGQTVYGGTKAAVESMTRCWARELAERCTVNAVNPGPVKGDMYTQAGEGFWKTMQGWQDNTPLAGVPADAKGVDEEDGEFLQLAKEKMGGRRPAYDYEIAGVVGMLCSADGAWCTGSVVCANGGLRMGI
jgi:NAD(P)-dependent dehydrogenase (short-subunit alcohol dehydrogenase family)